MSVTRWIQLLSALSGAWVLALGAGAPMGAWLAAASGASAWVTVSAEPTEAVEPLEAPELDEEEADGSDVESPDLPALPRVRAATVAFLRPSVHVDVVASAPPLWVGERPARWAARACGARAPPIQG